MLTSTPYHVALIMALGVELVVHLGAVRITTLSAKAVSYIPSPAECLLLPTSFGRGLLYDRRTPEKKRAQCWHTNEIENP